LILRPGYTATSYYPTIGGAQLYLHEVARRMVDDRPLRAVAFWERHRVDWLRGTTVNAPGRPWQREVDGIELRGIAMSPSERARVALPAALFYPMKSWAIRQIGSLLTDKIDAEFRGDLVHNSRIGREPFSFSSRAVARRRGVPFVFTPNHHPRWVGWNYREYLRLYTMADVLLVYTEAERDFLRTLGVEDRRVFVTGIGPVLADEVDAAAWRIRHGIDGPMVLYLGQKFRYKNFHMLLDAAPAVWAKHPRAHFVFIGPPTPFSRQHFARRAADERIVELGHVSLEDKTAALAACDMLCLPSPQESFGMVLVEAWSQGKPVVAARSPAVATLVSDGEDGLVVEPTPAGLAAAFIELLASSERRTSMGAAGAEKVRRRYTWERVMETVRAAYRAAHELPSAGD
jgi:glycosyltransferase involved in cell wall biosynthesis